MIYWFDEMGPVFIARRIPVEELKINERILGSRAKFELPHYRSRDSVRARFQRVEVFDTLDLISEDLLLTISNNSCISSEVNE